MSHSSKHSSKSKHSGASHNIESVERKRELFHRMGFSPKPIGKLLNRPLKRMSSKFQMEEKDNKKEIYFKNKTDVIDSQTEIKNMKPSLENIVELRRKTSKLIFYFWFNFPQNLKIKK